MSAERVAQRVLEALQVRLDGAKLADHMGERLDFGTAGLRGEMGPGFLLRKGLTLHGANR